MSTCNPGDASCRDFIDGNELTRRTVIKITVACAALFLFLVICGLCIRRRRIQERSIGLSRVAIRPPNPPKLSRVPLPLPVGYSGYYQSSPPPAIPQYPALGNDAYLGNPQSQGPSSFRRMPEPSAPGSPVSPRAPSSVTSRQSITSRPISSVHTAPLSGRGSEPALTAPSSPAPTLSTLPRSPQRRTAGIPLPLTSPSPQSNPSGANPSAPTVNSRSNPSRPPALSPMNTGISTGILDEPPPAYTPL